MFEAETPIFQVILYDDSAESSTSLSVIVLSDVFRMTVEDAEIFASRAKNYGSCVVYKGSCDLAENYSNLANNMTKKLKNYGLNVDIKFELKSI